MYPVTVFDWGVPSTRIVQALITIGSLFFYVKNTINLKEAGPVDNRSHTKEVFLIKILLKLKLKHYLTSALSEYKCEPEMHFLPYPLPLMSSENHLCMSTCASMIFPRTNTSKSTSNESSAHQ